MIFTKTQGSAAGQGSMIFRIVWARNRIAIEIRLGFQSVFLRWRFHFPGSRVPGDPEEIFAGAFLTRRSRTQEIWIRQDFGFGDATFHVCHDLPPGKTSYLAPAASDLFFLLSDSQIWQICASEWQKAIKITEKCRFWDNYSWTRPYDYLQPQVARILKIQCKTGVLLS